MSLMTRVFAKEFAKDGVTVNSGCPGWCKTDMAGDKGRRDTAATEEQKNERDRNTTHQGIGVLTFAFLGGVLFSSFPSSSRAVSSSHG